MTTPKKNGLALLIAAKPKEEDEPMVEEMGETPEQEAAEGPHQSTNYLTVPESFQPPDDKQMGQEFTTTIMGKMTEDGRLCVTQLSGIPMDGSETPPDAPEGTGEAEDAPTSEQAAAAPVNVQNEGGAIPSTPEVRESKKLKKLLSGR